MEAPVIPWSQAAHAHLLGTDLPMAALVRRQGPLARTLTRDYFGRLVRAVVGQRISSKAAASIYARLLARTGEPMIPQALEALTDDDIRACGFSINKLLAVRDLTTRALDRRLDLPNLDTLLDDEVAAQLVAVRGIGHWTAQMFLIFALGRPDVLAADDLGIQNAIKRVYALEMRPTPKAIRGMAEEGGWHPFATAACFHLWDSLKEPNAGKGIE